MENSPLEAAITPEVREQGIRLANIMMPYAMKQTREFFQRKAGQTHGRLVHYITAEAALSIIRTKRFWMRNTNCMSDYREVQHGLKSSIVSSLSKRNTNHLLMLWTTASPVLPLKQSLRSTTLGMTFG
jgi:hypothetical protein